MSRSINVNKQTVSELLGSGKNKPFIIPEYQRPYAWTREEVEILFTDLWDFTISNGGSTRDGTYFLGSVVSYENENGEQEIIDGQQRITSLFLLLRAIYTKLKTGEESEESKNFIKMIEPTIWKTNKLTGAVDYSKILLTSHVVNNRGNEILHKILETGIASKNAKDNYSRNYNFFIEYYEDFCRNSPLIIFEFIYAVLNQAILLPIEADTQDTALTIFSTLNDRGLPLSDSDIFKAKIYNNLDDEEKALFIEEWKVLDESARSAQEWSIQSLFYYYMFYLRAKQNDSATTTPGLRKYYALDKFTKLYDKNLLNDLEKILNLWKVINNKEILEEEDWSTNSDTIKALDILTSYPNEFWKYPVINYYLSHKESPNFKINFTKFLRKLIVALLSQYLVMPTISAVKTEILKLNVELITTEKPQFEFKKIELDTVKKEIFTPHGNVVRMILKMLAYEKQEILLPEKWEIEHIFPRKWQNNYFLNETDEFIREKIEFIGNKVPFEKKLNIVAGNGYFEKKKNSYKESKIKITYDLSELPISEWGLSNIEERSTQVSEIIINLLKKWSDDYENSVH